MLTVVKSLAFPLTNALTAALVIVVPVAVFADEKSDSQSVPTVIGPSEILNMGTSLVLILIAIVLVGWLFRRSQGMQKQSGEIIHVLATQALGPKERVLLVEVGNKQLVLGMTATQIQTLHVLEQPLASDSRISSPTGFAVRLRAAIKRARE